MNDARDETARMMAKQAMDAVNQHTAECAKSYRELRQSVRAIGSLCQKRTAEYPRLHEIVSNIRSNMPFPPKWCSS